MVSIDKNQNLIHRSGGKGAGEKGLNDPTVRMSNALVRAAHGLTLSEKRLIACCIAQLDSRRRWTPDKLRVRLRAVDYAKTFGLDDRTAYEALEEAADNLFGRYIGFRVKKRKGFEVDKVRWIGGVKYHTGEGWVELVFNHMIAPHLFQLRKEFTAYKLKQASAVRSIYAWRLSELFAQFQRTRLLRIPLDEFRHAMDVPDSLQKSFNDLRRRCIEAAVQELQRKSDLDIEWRPIKKGRAVASLEFKWCPAAQPSLPL